MAERDKELLVQVKYGPQMLEVSLQKGNSVGDLNIALQKLTNILPRGQKLIHKGKVLTADMTLEMAGIKDKAKLMLLPSAGLQRGTIPPKTAAVPKKVAPSSALGRSAIEERLAAAAARYPSGGSKEAHISKAQEKARQEGWQKTGVVSLRDSNLQVLPDSVWAVGQSLRVLDLGGNLLSSFQPPASAGLLVNLQRLRLSSNALTDASIAWEALSQLPQLTALAIDNNQLTSLPPAIGQLKALRRLTVAHNALSSLAPELGSLHALEWLDVSTNNLRELPDSLGDVAALEELSACDNQIAAVPLSMARLDKLKILLLDNNALPSFPSDVLKGCSQLTTLSLHGNEVVVEQLRELPGWDDFNERRKAKYTKQLDFNAMGTSSGFDEGADTQRWHHW
eukprot:jgi/Mesen1/2140/ME000152S01226